MTWAKLDDGFYDRDAVLGTDLAALGLFALARVYCARHQTDGRVSGAVVTMLARGAEIGAHLASVLVAQNLWACDGSDFRDLSFLTDNPSSREVEKAKKAARVRMRTFRSRSPERNGPVRANKRRTNTFVPERSGEERSSSESSSGVEEGSGEKPTSEPVQLIEEINRVGGKQFSVQSKANLTFARARIAEYPLAHLLAMIRWRWRTWDAEKRADYFRPETLLNATKCASYVGGMPASELRAATIMPVVVQPTALAKKFAERDRLMAEKAVVAGA